MLPLGPWQCKLQPFWPFCIYPKWKGWEVCETASRNACRSTGPPALPWHDGHDGHDGRNGMSFIMFHISPWHFCPVSVRSFCPVCPEKSLRYITVQGLRTWEGSPDFLTCFPVCSSIFLRKDHIAVTRAHLDTSGPDSKRRHRTVLF